MSTDGFSLSLVARNYDIMRKRRTGNDRLRAAKPSKRSPRRVLADRTLPAANTPGQPAATGPTQARSGPGPDLIAKQRSRDDGSSAAGAVGRSTRLAHNEAVPSALDAGGSAPLHTRFGTSSRAQVSQTSLLHADEVAVMLGVSKAWVYAEVRAGRMPHVKLGRYVRFRRESIADWVSGLESATMR
jgi:excisionase family DNA binding protein